MTVRFKEAQTSENIKKFLNDLASALTVSFVPRQFDPWNGNLVVDIDWFSMRLTEHPANERRIKAEFLAISISKESQVLSAETLNALSKSELTEIFVDGMRASQPKSKYANWFILIENLERRALEEPYISFDPLFSENERQKIIDAVDLPVISSNKLKTFLGDRNLTVMNRADKLFSILKHIGIINISVNENEHNQIDLDLCKEIIKQRNSLAHNGSKVDEDLLYKKLFPLSYQVLKYLMK